MFPRSFVLLIAVVSVLAEEERCLNDFSVGFLYKELGCKPVYEEASKCPSHFDCSDYAVRTKSNTCTYKGETYDIGSDIPPEKTSPCVATCRCLEDRATGLGIFSCANVECFDWYLENENCTRLYTEDSCCSVKTHCKGDRELPTCLVDGKVYVEGQKFYPEAEPCKVCHCKAGFEGKYVEPFCHDVSCEVELHYASRIQQKCVPVYYGKQGCCPIDWKCPSGEKDEIIPFKGQTARTTQARCRFGDLEFQQYEELKTNDPNVECKCLVPPYLTCTYIPKVLRNPNSDPAPPKMLNSKVTRGSTMNDNMKRCAFHILQIEPNLKSNSVCKYGRRMRRRLTPYYVPGGRVVFVENETIHERTHRKSENSDTGNENEDFKDCDTYVSSVGLFRSKSLENINSSSHNFNFTHDFLIELESRKNTNEASDVEFVSSKMKCLNV